MTIEARKARAALAVTCALALLATPAVAAAAPETPERDRGPGLVREPAGGAAGEAAERSGAAAEPATSGALVVTTRDDRVARHLGARVPALLAARGVPAGAASEVAPGVARIEVAPGRQAEATAELARQPGVVSVEPDYALPLLAQPDDPRFEEQWAHAQTGIAAAWDHTTGSTEVTVAILDSGVDGTHPDLEDNVHAQVNVADGTPDPPGDGTGGPPRDNVDCPPDSDGYDHGTAVAGVVGAEGDNGLQVAGVAWRVGIVDVAVTGTNLPGGGSDAQKCNTTTVAAVTAGLRWVHDHHPDVAAVNMSFGLGLPECPSSIQEEVDRLRELGVTVVAAAGNDGGFGRIMPAGCDGVIAVGATRGDRELAGYSSRQRYVDLVAPGGGRHEGVLTTRRHPDHGLIALEIAGTSFAAPYVAGVVALAQDVRRRGGEDPLRPSQVESLLEITARHPAGSGVHDERFGWGRLHAGDAIAHVAAGAGIPSLREHPLIRWARGDGQTEPVRQAIAVSEGLFDRRSAAHVLVARADDYADALAGSALGFGVGPILFTPRDQPLFPPVRREIERVLPPGGRVYLLGGTQAVHGAVEQELGDRGYDVVRLSGPTREWTAAEIAAEVVERVDQLGFHVNSGAVVATRGNWPDAVAGGSLAALYGLPTLLTPVNSLHPATEAALKALAPRQVYVVGGSAAVSSQTAQAVAGVTGLQPQRLAGPTRVETAVAVGSEIERELGFSDLRPTFGIAVNLDRPDGYAHTLAASAAAGRSASVFVPLNWTAQRGTWLNDSASAYACGLGVDVLLPGDVDLLPDSVARSLQDLYDRSLPAC